MSIKLQGLHKAFGSKRILEGFDLEVQEGETLAILGASGVGKSVTLKHVVGLLYPDAGEVFVQGQNVGALDEEGLVVTRVKKTLYVRKVPSGPESAGEGS